MSATSSTIKFFDECRTFLGKVKDIRSFYEIMKFPNRIEDGREPYPENSRTVGSGIAIEFRQVSSHMRTAEVVVTIFV